MYIGHQFQILHGGIVNKVLLATFENGGECLQIRTKEDKDKEETDGNKARRIHEQRCFPSGFPYV